MPAIEQMLSKLSELHKASNHPENKYIYSQLITAFSPAADTVLSFEQIVSGIILIAQHRDNIQESAAVSFFYKKTSRKAVLDGFISAIMQEYAQQPEFVTVMERKILELEEWARQDIVNYPALLAAEVNTAKSELSDAKQSQEYWETITFGQLKHTHNIDDDGIDAQCKAAGQLVLEKQAQLKMAEKQQKSPGNNYQEIFFKTSSYLSKMLDAATQEVACEDNQRGV
ncbi:MAG: hypothetical protein KBD83_04140 [Gammaproteobacteria bacterium]|nr:hypothetical protein [Gammaproteobacteria bacterium]